MSKLSASLSATEIEAIGTVSSQNNAQLDITGLLVFFTGLFFQIIEGDDAQVDALYEKIIKDARHIDIVCLKAEYDIEERLFPTWSMKTINLDNSDNDELTRPIRILFQTLTESHNIIERYTQPAVLKILNRGLNPLAVSPISAEKIILFGDIFSYSTISEQLEMSDVVLMLNRYFEICSRVIFARGGEINKFIGDGVMAYFDYDQADNAIHACLDILQEIELSRQNAPDHSPLQLLYSGFGLAKGVVIEGNMGSHIKTDYTVIGDAVNTAARLESLTREVKRSLVVSDSIMRDTQEAWRFVNLGNYNLKGKSGNNDVYSIENRLTASFMEKEALHEKLQQVLKKEND
jgi:class 3 adenylate cyclase